MRCYPLRMAALSGPHRDPASGRPADSLVVMLHGIGADGNDLISLADQFAGALPDTAFHAPDAPRVMPSNARNTRSASPTPAIIPIVVRQRTFSSLSPNRTISSIATLPAARRSH